MRPEVRAFAEAMEKRLQANDHKGGWRDEPLDYLFERIEDEVAELRTATRDRNFIWPLGGILEEAADVGNFAMMAADRCEELSSEVFNKWAEDSIGTERSAMWAGWRACEKQIGVELRSKAAELRTRLEAQRNLIEPLQSSLDEPLVEGAKRAIHSEKRADLVFPPEYYETRANVLAWADSEEGLRRLWEAVAVKVMGWQLATNLTGPSTPYYLPSKKGEAWVKGEFTVGSFRPDWMHLGIVIEAMQENGWRLQLSPFSDYEHNWMGHEVGWIGSYGFPKRFPKPIKAIDGEMELKVAIILAAYLADRGL